MAPASVFAQDDGCEKLQQGFSEYGGRFADTVSGLPKFCNATDMLQFLINTILGLVGGITMILIIFGGYRYITASGNQEQAEKGKQTVIWAAIGLGVVLMSAAIINIVINVAVNDKLF